jgi:hypothetical protein
LPKLLLADAVYSPFVSETGRAQLSANASDNVLRYDIVDNLNLGDFQLS